MRYLEADGGIHYGGIYFDIDVKPKSAFSTWGFGNRTVVTGRGCNNKRHPAGCAHQWGLIYSPFHPVLHKAIKETLQNLATRDAVHVYDVSFWAFYNAWVKGPYNSSYMPRWGDNMGGRVIFSDKETKDEMVSANGHWPDANGKNRYGNQSVCNSNFLVGLNCKRAPTTNKKALMTSMNYCKL